jgi:hypothetical protein
MSTTEMKNGISNGDEQAAEEEEFFSSRVWTLLIQEARAVSLWSCVSIMLRLALIFLCTLASYRNDKSVIHSFWFVKQPVSESTQELWTIASVFAGWILCLAPSKVLTQQAPGFTFANPG